MASLMRRAVQQAKAEAAAAKVQEPKTEGQDVKANAHPGGLEQAKPLSGDQRALASKLKKAAQRMQQQQEEEEAAAQSEEALLPLATPATAQQGSASLQDSASSDAGFVITEQLQAQAGTTQEAASPGEAQLSATCSRASSLDSAEGLLPGLPPERNQSLGERLGSMLRGALSLARQSSYSHVAADDNETSDSAAAAATSHLSPVAHRALPRDASYLPEWLNRTLSLSGSTHQDDGLETESLLQEQAEDVMELPQWVDWSTIQLEDGAAPIKQRPAPLALPVDEPPSIQPMLESESILAQPLSTPKGHRLFEFWQQKSAAAAIGLPEPQAPDPLAPPVYAHRRQAASHKGRTRLSLEAPRPTLGPPQQQLHSDVAHEAAAAESQLQHVAESQSLQAGPTHPEVAAELAATSLLVQQQSARQAELLEGLEQALSQISQHRLLVQNPSAQLQPLLEEGTSDAETCVVSAYHDCCTS